MSGSIRPATEHDAPQIRAIYAPFVLYAPVSFEEIVPTQEEMAARITRTLERFPWLVVADGDNILGYAYASEHRARAAYRWSVDVAVYIHEQHRRAGIGRALYTSLLAMLPLQGFFNAYAGITLPNSGSVRLHEAMGFLPVGVYRAVGYKAGQWHDVGWWQRSLRSEGRTNEPPNDPLPLALVQKTEAWKQARESGEKFLR
jgi:phosphinothricin acetyltransferase